jgi:hypothetical protein
LWVSGFCSDPLEIAFSSFVAHQEMCERDVLHRDISWGNIMCRTADGRYLNGTKVSEDDIADILSVLSVLFPHL